MQAGAPCQGFAPPRPLRAPLTGPARLQKKTHPGQEVKEGFGERQQSPSLDRMARQASKSVTYVAGLFCYPCSRLLTLTVRVLPVSNHANVDDVFSIVDGVDNPIVSRSNPPEIRRAS